jgi:phosphoribosyl-dephospho-CoA transferase
LVPVGVRGATRSQRFAAWLPIAEMVTRLAPADLIVAPPALTPQRRAEVPALAALTRVAPLLTRRGKRWGPGGSVGFELATGAPTATAASDLDLIIRRECRRAPEEAAELWAALVAAAAPARVDVVLETPHGGVALAELAARPARLLIRTPDGPHLLADPWQGTAEATRPDARR